MKKVVIIGGGAGGMTAATQIKRFDNSFTVTLFEKSEYVSWAGCPSPYYIAGDLPFKSVLHYDANYFKENRDIDVYTKHELKKIDYENNKVIIEGKDLSSEIEYDYLILALGAKPNLIKKTEGIKGIFTLNHIDKTIAIKKFIDENSLKNAVIIGSGLIGLEMAEAFSKLGIAVSIIEKKDEIMDFLNKKMKKTLEKKIEEKKIKMFTSNSVVEFKNIDNRIKAVTLESGEELEADIIISSIGVKPNLDILIDSGFELEDGKLFTDTKMRTYIKNIYAIGDMVWNNNLITGEKIFAPMGDIANKHAYTAAASIVGKKVEFKGILGAMATSFFDMKIAKTGISLEKALDLGIQAKRLQFNNYPKIQGFYMNKEFFNYMDIVYDESEQVVLGAVAVGDEAVAQFIDQISILIINKIKIDDFFNIDFAYSPTNSSVWNPILNLYRKLEKNDFK